MNRLLIADRSHARDDVDFTYVFSDLLPTRAHLLYPHLQWIQPSAILIGKFHPALKYAVASLLAGRKLDEMRAAVATSPAGDDATIARLAREFAALSSACEPAAGRSGYRVVAPQLQYEGGVEVTL